MSNSDVHDKSGKSPVPTVVIILLVIYLLPLLALAIDEIVLRTYWLSRTFPAGSRDVFFDVYPFLAPLFK